MTTNIRALSEYSGTTIPLAFHISESDGVSTTGWLNCAHKVVIYSAAVAAHAGKGRPIADVVARHERDERKRGAIERARQRLARSVEAADGLQTMTSLRLSRGLSQAALAEKIGQKQPYVARLERERQDLRASTIIKLAAALEVSADTIIKLTSKVDD